MEEILVKQSEKTLTYPSTNEFYDAPPGETKQTCLMALLRVATINGLASNNNEPEHLIRKHQL